MAIQLEEKNKEWIAEFLATTGRPPRVLHISNVANNAYNNAKLLNQCGLENHVLANDAYYAMGCPEWEDADFKKPVLDMWNPDWYEIDINGFSRPRWFAQGDLATCVAYLAALCEGREEEAQQLFQALSKKNRTAHPGKTDPHNSLNSLILFAAGTASKANLLVRRFIRQGLTAFDKTLNTSLLPTLRRLRAPSAVDTGKEFAKAFLEEFRAEFPERLDQLSADDLSIYYAANSYISQLMDKYEFVIGYAVEGAYPLMLRRNYFAFEHGTIRDIPYKSDTQGRMCALAYRKAAHVFVTNFDCISSAEFLAPKRFTVINHPYDEDQPLFVADDWQQQRSTLLKELDADFLFFHPTRHDWVPGTGYADKANDIFLKAFGRLRQQGLRLGMVCCEWGANIKESKALMAELGVLRHVRWINPLGVIGYTRMCKAAHVVVDQFKLGAFGGVTFKALASGAPVMIYLDMDRISGQYSEAPPVLNCKTEADIAASITYWYTRQDELKEFGASGRAWMKKFHNKSDIVNAQVKQFRKLLPTVNNLRESSPHGAHKQPEKIV